MQRKGGLPRRFATIRPCVILIFINLVTSCESIDQTTPSLSVSSVSSSDSNDILEYVLNYPVVSKQKLTDTLQKSINETFYEFRQELSRERLDLLNRGATYEYLSDFTVSYNSSKTFVSFLIRNSYKASDQLIIHTRINCFSFDIRSERMVTVGDLFRNPTKAFSRIVLIIAEKLRAQNNPESLDISELHASRESLERFIVSENGITFLFEPGVIASEETGVLESHINWSELPDLALEELRES